MGLIMDKLTTRSALFQSHNFAERELKRRYDCAERFRREARLKRATEHRELMASVSSPAGQETAKEEWPYWLRRYYSTQFMTEDWLTHPEYIDCENWMLTPRPLGVKCLLVASRGLTVAVSRHGELIGSFQSALPNGGQETGSANAYTVMEAVYSEETGSYFILDVLTWNGVSLYEHPAEYRLLLSRQYVKDASSIRSEVPLCTTPVYKCSPEAIQTVYSSTYSFPIDGLLFYRDSGEYVLGINPEVLLWKDSHCSPHPIDDNVQQLVTLHLSSSGRLMTLDKIHLYTLSPDLVSERHLHSGMLVTLTTDGVDLESMEPALLNPQFFRVARKSKLRADQWSRILFQSISRQKAISIDDILSAAGKFPSLDWSEMTPTLYTAKTGRIGLEHKPSVSMDVD